MHVRAALSLLVLSAAFAGCSDDGVDPGQILKDKDSGISFDLGTVCDANPNGCFEHQLMSAACECLAGCEAGYAFTATGCVAETTTDPDGGSASDVGGGTSDGGLDAGTTADSGPSTGADAGTAAPDAGSSSPDAGVSNACLSDSDCGGSPNACVRIDATSGTVNSCSGASDCECVISCDPFVSNAHAACGTGNACTWAGSSAPISGLCVLDGGPATGTQTAACTMQFDSAGNPTSQSGCNSSQNYYCWGATPEAPTGRCGSFCDPNRTTGLCSGLGSYACVDVTTNGSIGLCLAQSSATDLSAGCTADTQCQDNLCVSGLGCSSSCAGLAACPSNAICADVGTGPVCLRECTTDNTCSSLNSENICQSFGTVSICWPRCTADSQCQTGTTCNTSTGHCQ